MPARGLTHARRLANAYWQHRFGLLLALLLAMIGGHPLLATLATRSGIAALETAVSALSWLLMVSLMALVAGVVRSRTRLILAALAIVYLVTVISVVPLAGFARDATREGAGITACVLGIYACGRHALRPGQVNEERIWAALDAYLLAGFALGSLYFTLETVWPDSFGAPDSMDLTPGKAVYFSFITLATVGYGDISPASDVTRGLAVLEAIAGQGYLAILVARLVSLRGGSDARE